MKKSLIDITFNLLYKKGYCATSIKDILDIAKITKGSMYYHFESKHDLVLSSMHFYLEFILNEHWITPLKKSQKPIDTLTSQIELYMMMFSDDNSFLELKHGCPLSNFILDMSDKDEAFFEYLKDVYNRWQISLKESLLKAKELDQTHTDFDAECESMFIMSSLEGCIGSAKAYNDIRVLEKGFKILIKHVEKL